MIKCQNCKWKYPEEFVSDLILGHETYMNTCGVCALELINQFHGIYRDKFDGEMAEMKRMGAIAWRRNHPECQP